MYTRKRRVAATRQYQKKRKVAAVAVYQPRQLMRGEWKYVDYTINNMVCDTTGQVGLINGIAPGTSASTRVGMNVMIKSIELAFSIYGLAATCVDNFSRMLVVLDRQTNGAAPAITDVVNGATYYDRRNLSNRRRFRILYDKVVTLNAGGEPGTRRYFKKYIKFPKGVKEEFNTGVAGTVADIVSNGLFIMTMGSAAPGNTGGYCQGISRIRYTDM